MTEHFKHSVDRRPVGAAVFGAVSLAIGLNLPVATAHTEATKPNVICTGQQEIDVSSYPSTTADGILETKVNTPPADRLKADGTMQSLAYKIVNDPATVNPTRNDPRLYYIAPGSTAEQIRVDDKYHLNTFHWPTHCAKITDIAS